jgi:hypothetical protein
MFCIRILRTLVFYAAAIAIGLLVGVLVAERLVTAGMRAAHRASLALWPDFYVQCVPHLEFRGTNQGVIVAGPEGLPVRAELLCYEVSDYRKVRMELEIITESADPEVVVRERRDGPRLEGDRSGNLVFAENYRLPGGMYRVTIKAIDKDSGGQLASRHTLGVVPRGKGSRERAG